MPKTKKIEEKDKIIEVDSEEKDLDADVVPGEEVEEEHEEDSMLDDDEVNPFGDKWEE